MKKNILFVSFLLLIFFAKAQIFTSKIEISNNIISAEALEAADFNNDGYADLVYSSLGDNHLSVSLFDPATRDFNHTPIVVSTQMNYCLSVFAADLDGDGFQDILAASQYYNDIVWYKNDGNANFTQQPLINNNARFAAAVVAFDIDNDGDNDVVSASKDDHLIAWYENDGTGNFSAKKIITDVAEIPVALAFADLNNDGFTDILAGYAQTDKIVYFLNNGDTTFAEPVTLTDQTDYIFTIKTADINNDGFIDVVSASKNDNKVAWYKNLAGTGFSSQIIICDTIEQAYDLALADFDLDDDIDIAVSESNTNAMYLFSNTDGNGTFAPLRVISDYLYKPKGIAAADFNNDGVVDLAVTSSERDRVFWFWNAKANFLEHSINFNHISTCVTATDIDEDGDADIFYSSHDAIYAVANLGVGNFSEEFALYEDGYNINTIKLVDIDNDGDEDLVVADGQGDESFWFRNEGSGAFSEKITIDNSGDGPIYPDFGDYDNDGDVDILMLLISETAIVVYENNGSGNFQKNTISDTTDYYTVKFTDLDNDGNLDIFFSKYSSAGYYPGNGDGSFQNEVILDTNLGYAWNSLSIDMNNDNYEDILFSPDYYLHYWQNNQDATYSDTYLDNGGLDDFCVGDIDNDGDIDIISASWSPDYVTWTENINFADTFIVQQPVMVKDAHHVAVDDLNNDGWNDIIVGSWPAEQLVWLENFMYRIINQPQDVFICDENYAHFNVYATGVENYQWQVNQGSGFVDITDDTIYNGANKAVLNINNITSGMIGYQYRCLLLDKQNNQLITDTATLNLFTPSIECIDNQEVIENGSGYYTVTDNEFDIDTVYNKCNEILTLTNNYNNDSTLAGEMFAVGNYLITWYLIDNTGNLIDSCDFELSVLDGSGIRSTVSEPKIFPNPVDNILKIDLASVQDNTTVEIFNIQGKKISHQLYENKQVIQIDFSEQPAGIYMLRIRTPEKVFVEKILKR